MKKTLAIILALVMVFAIFTLVGCGSSSEETATVEDTADAVTVAIVVPSGFGDMSFNDSAKEGAEQLKADLNVDVKYVECGGTEFKQNMMNAAEEAEIVVCVGWEFWEIEEVVGDYPDTKFIWIDNEAEGQYDNLLNIIYAQNEGSFLAGYAAAKMSTTGVIGAVGGEDSITINDFVVGYKQGAEYANPDIKVEVNYAGTYDDPAKGKECALALNSKGADVIFQIAGSTGSGVFQAAQENGFYAIGVDQDQKISAPSYDDVIICSMVKQVGTSIYDKVSEYIENGSLAGGTWVADMSNGYIGLGYGGDDSVQQISDEIKAEVEDLQAQILSGDIVVDTTR